MEILVAVVIGLLVIAAASSLGARLGVAAPLLLVVVGLGVSLIPALPTFEIAPEWILTGVLPPLLYSAAVSMPTMNFRREFTAIGGLSIALVVFSALALGLFFAWVIPGLGIWWGIALGAIVSPTDAVATSIVKRIGGSSRVSAILEGEGLFNDATALVVLRTAVAGVAVSVSFWGVLGDFFYSVAVAVIIGYAVGWLNLRIRSRMSDAAVNTVISFTVPFLASIPAEALGASGLVAAAVAGLVTGHGAARLLTPQHRLSDTENWRTIALILEGAVFLLMGLELSAIIANVRADHNGLGTAVVISAGALFLTIIVRAVYVGPLIGSLAARAERGAQMKPQIAAMQDRLENPDKAVAALNEARSAQVFGPGRPAQSPSVGRSDRAVQRARLVNSTRPIRPDRPARSTRERRPPTAEQLAGLQTRLRRTLADINYFLAEPLGWREGVIIVWAGMRGVVTLAAAQSLPENAPSRSLLIFVAFLVATGSLLLQGLTLPRVAKWVLPANSAHTNIFEEHAQIMALLDSAAATVTEHATTDSTSAPALEPTADAKFTDEPKRAALAVLNAQRRALLDARDDGMFSADTLNTALAILDADQISLEMKGPLVEAL